VNKARRILMVCIIAFQLVLAPACYAMGFRSLSGGGGYGGVSQQQMSQWVGTAVEDLGSQTLDDGTSGDTLMFENVSLEGLLNCVDQLTNLGFNSQILGSDDETLQYYLTKGGQELILLYSLNDDGSTRDLIAFFLTSANAAAPASQIESMKANTLVADIDGQTTEFELSNAFAPGTGQSVTFEKKDVRGYLLENITLLLPGALFEGDVIDSGNYDSAKYGLCGLMYFSRQRLLDSSKDQFMAQYTYDMGNDTSSFDAYFNAPLTLVMLPDSRASFKITCEYMSADGRSLGGRVEGSLIRQSDGSQVSITNGYYKFSTR
jgi:hypothetical protein